MSRENDSVHPGWVRHLLAMNGWSQAQLAEALGVNYSLVSRWKNGSRTPDEALWKAMAKLACVDAPTYWKGAPT